MNSYKATVKKVTWKHANMSKVLQPTVEIYPININNTIVQHVCGINASFIKNNIIGFGSRVLITMTEDIFPHIHSVLSPSTNNTYEFPIFPYEWTYDVNGYPSGILDITDDINEKIDNLIG